MTRDTPDAQPIVVEMVFPTDTVGLSETLPADAELDVEAEKVVPTQQNSMPYLWVPDKGIEQFTRTVPPDPPVDAVQLYAVVEGGRLYKIAWNESETDLLHWIGDNNTAVLNGETEV